MHFRGGRGGGLRKMVIVELCKYYDGPDMIPFTHAHLRVSSDNSDLNLLLIDHNLLLPKLENMGVPSIQFN